MTIIVISDSVSPPLSYKIDKPGHPAGHGVYLMYGLVHLSQVRVQKVTFE